MVLKELQLVSENINMRYSKSYIDGVVIKVINSLGYIYIYGIFYTTFIRILSLSHFKAYTLQFTCLKRHTCLNHM